MEAGISFVVVLTLVNGITSFIVLSKWLLIIEKLFDFYILISKPNIFLTLFLVLFVLILLVF